MSKQRLEAALLIAAAALIGCSSDSAGPDSREPSELQLLRVENYVPGAIATLYGTSLTSLQQLRVDADTIREFVIRSDTTATFTVPIGQQCEVDGRRVRIIGNDADTLTIQLDIPALHLEVGESRVLHPQVNGCITLPAGNEDYVLTAANLELPPGTSSQPRSLITLRTYTESSLQAAPASLRHIRTSGSISRHGASVDDVVITGSTGRVGNAGLFDARYATAVTGDTVTMIAWTRNASTDAALCTAARETLPTFKAVVMAVAGRIAILGDLRDPIIQSLMNGNDRTWIQRVADVADPVLIPTMRSVFDADFQPPSTAGGRYMVLMTSMPTGSGYAFDGIAPYGTGAVPGVCANSSDVITTLISSEAWGKLPEAATFRVKALAATIIHEYSHNVDSRMHHAAGRALSPAPSGMLSEAWASLAEETATRIAIKQSANAQHSRITDSTPDNGMALMGMWGVYSTEGPWGLEGRYTLSPQLLLFAREAAGEASVEHNRRPTFYQRLNVDPPSIADRPAHARAVAEQAGMTIDSLVDMHALASATAGLLSAAVYQQRSLPRFTSWDMSDVAIATGPYSATFSLRVPHTGPRDVNLTAAAGGFASAYLMADASGSRGLSLRVEAVGPYRSVVRLTRLR